MGFQINVSKTFRDAVVAALREKPLGTHEIALAIGHKDYGSLHTRLRCMELDGMIHEAYREMRRTRADRPPGKQIIWALGRGGSAITDPRIGEQES